jgi:tetraacyldisaccharide 4'-kinase
MKRLDQYWYSQNPLAWLLLPLSWLFCAVAVLRRLMYQKRLLAAYSVEAPVIIVGNISVGGTGKTPLLISLCDYLVRHGYRPGVISRGYGADTDVEYSISPDDDAAACGDEPLLIRQRTACPVVIGRDRVAAAQKLLAENDCDVVLSDDGLQHYRLNRDIEIAVVDARRRFGNGFCLPAGPLREPVSRLNRTTMVVHHGDENECYSFFLKFGDALNLDTGGRRAVESFEGEPVHAVAGIGYPRRFFDQLRSAGLDVIEHGFPDHHRYAAGDVDFDDGAPVLMTEKDAVKCRPLLAAGPADGKDRNFWAVPVDAVLSDRLGRDLGALLERVR